MPFTNYLEDSLLNHSLRNGTGGQLYTSPSIWIGLIKDNVVFLDSGFGTQSEFSGGGYARKYIAPADLNASSNGTVTNANALTFPQATGNWGTAHTFVLFDSGTAGNAMMFGTLVTDKVILNGDTPSFAAASLKVGLD